MTKKIFETKNSRTEMLCREGVRSRLKFTAAAEMDELFAQLNTGQQGLTADRVDDARDEFGDNSVTRGKKVSLPKRLVGAFITPFAVILVALAAISTFTDIIYAEPGEMDLMVVIIISTMVILSGILRFVQETRSGHAAENLLKMIKTTTNVERQETGKQEIPLSEVVVGDIVHLSAGDMIPADMRIIRAKDFFISQSALTGENVAVEKLPCSDREEYGALTETTNLAFMGSNVISSSATGVVIVTENGTFFGEMARSVNEKPVKTTFEKGVNSVSWVLIRFMLVMVPIVLFVNGFTKGDWMEATLFALAVAVGLTPEMLPMIVTTCLVKGAVTMSKEKTIIKNLNSIQNLGSMNVLCTDKTGTLTQDKVVLMYHLNIHGQEDARVLRHAFLNSYYQTGLKNLIDVAIINRTQEEEGKEDQLRGLADRYTKVDEIPFDFERRRMSVVVANGHTQMITKGAVEEMLAVCSHAEYEGKEMPLTDYSPAKQRAQCWLHGRRHQRCGRDEGFRCRYLCRYGGGHCKRICRRHPAEKRFNGAGERDH
jgi:Mg2+-importing ATPase